MNRLVIIGASGLGREVLGYALDVPPRDRDWVVAGFLDADPSALDGFDIDYPILGNPSTYQPGKDDRFVCAIGDPGTRLKLCREMKNRGGRFATIFHPSIVLGLNNRVGEGCIFSARSGLSANVSIGNHVILNGHAGVGHDAVIGDGVTISSFCDVTGNAVLGEGVFLGSHAVILPGVKVGDFARIGAGSVVVRNVPPGASMFGNPAKQVAGFDPEGP